jgi:hypothetical protein
MVLFPVITLANESKFGWLDYATAYQSSMISGTVYNDSAAPGNEVEGAYINACLPSNVCQTTMSNSDGSYVFNNLDAGQYQLAAYPPAGNNRMYGLLGPLTLPDNSTLLDQNFILLQPTPMPTGTTITSDWPSSNVDGMPMVNWNHPYTLTTTGCSGATAASYEVIQNGVVISSGIMVESPAGTYTAPVVFPSPYHGYANIIITLQCPGDDPTQIAFNIYIDPSGMVVDANGNPVTGATVTLYRSDLASGPFEVVPSGSGVMASANRVNPMLTNSAGLFGWDVIAGYYKVRAEKSGCVNANDHAQLYAQTDVLTIPPPVTDLRLELYCIYYYMPLVIH